MPRRKAVPDDDPASQNQIIESAGCRAMAIPELLELVLDDENLICNNLQFRLVNRLWNATCQATILRDIAVQEQRVHIECVYSVPTRIVATLLDNEPQLACLIRTLQVQFDPLRQWTNPPLQEGDGRRILDKITPFLRSLENLILDSKAMQSFFAGEPAMTRLKSLTLQEIANPLSVAMRLSMQRSLAQSLHLQALSVRFMHTYFSRRGTIRVCTDFFETIGRQLQSLELALLLILREALHMVLKMVASHCPMLRTLGLAVECCEEQRLKYIKPLLIDTLQHITLNVGYASCLTGFLKKLVNPSFLPNLTTAPTFTHETQRFLKGDATLAVFEEALHALEQRGTIKDLESMRADLHHFRERQIRGE